MLESREPMVSASRPAVIWALTAPFTVPPVRGRKAAAPQKVSKRIRMGVIESILQLLYS